MRRRAGFTVATAGVGAALVAAMATGLAGCAGGWPTSGADAERARAAAIARERVAELARSIGDERPQDVHGFARAAVTEASPETGGESAGIELIGIEELQSERVDEPYGRLEFRVSDAFALASTDPSGPADASEPVEFCFRVTFDYYGKVGEWSTTDGVDPFDCSPDATPVTPPADTTVREIVAVNAREVAQAVLSERLATGLPQDAEGIAAAILARLEPPTGEYEVVAEPSVLVEAGASGTAGGGGAGGTGSTLGVRVGVAMGRAESCVLVKLDDGVVTDVRPPAVLLQPGELGCTPDTALADPEQLRPPH